MMNWGIRFKGESLIAGFSTGQSSGLEMQAFVPNYIIRVLTSRLQLSIIFVGSSGGNPERVVKLTKNLGLGCNACYIHTLLFIYNGNTSYQFGSSWHFNIVIIFHLEQQD